MLICYTGYRSITDVYQAFLFFTLDCTIMTSSVYECLIIGFVIICAIDIVLVTLIEPTSSRYTRHNLKLASLREKQGRAFTMNT